MSGKIRVGLVFGGRSGEHEVSIASASSVFSALDKEKYEVVLIGIDKNGRWLLPNKALLLSHLDDPMQVKLLSSPGVVSIVPEPGQQTPSLQKLDVVLPILHGSFGEDGTIQGLLEMANIPYVGSGVLGSAIGMDKEVARRLLKAAGIPVVSTLCLKKNAFKADPKSIMKEVISQFSLPFFVKPCNAGSSVGVSKVKTAEQLELALRNAFAFDIKVLVEQGVSARELECSVLGNDVPKASVIGEIIPNHEFYSYEAKYLDENGMSFNIPAKNLQPEVAKRIQDYALKAFRTLELRGLARVDFFMDKVTGELFLNEVNTMPGFTKISMYPKMWEASGLSYSALLDELIRLAIEHHAEKSDLKTSITGD